MKRSCNGCKALEDRGGNNTYCQLGYKLEDKISPDHIYFGILHQYRPLEECPKPTTNDKLMKLYNSRA